MAIVSTRHVTITNPAGDRLKKAIWTAPKIWRKYKEVAANLKQAITYARKVLAKKQIGTIVYVEDTPVYHCKWGGGRGFQGWKNNPVAEYWRRKLK